MARLPLSGSDDGTWGDILNDFLAVAHDTSTGAIKAGAITSSSLQDDSITEPKLAASNTASNGQILGYNGTALTWTNAGSSDPAMGGDLSGVASNAQIVAGAVGATEIAATSITNSHISGSAAIDQSKVASLTTDLAAKVPTSRTLTTSTGLTGGGDLSANRTLSVVDDTTTQKVRISKAGTLTGTRREVNLVEGSNVTITTADDSINNRVNVTIAASGGGAGEANTASNVGTAGVGVFKQKTGVDLEFKKISSGSSRVSITDDTGNNEVDIDVVEGSLDPANFATNPLARANHTGTQDATTITGTKTSSFISDFTEASQDAVGGALTDTASVDLTYNDGSNTISAAVIDNSSTQKVELAKAGTLTGTRKRINLIEGSNVTITTADNSGSDRVDVTIAASGGGAASSITTVAAGDLSSTDVQSALNELDTEKVSKSLGGKETVNTVAASGTTQTINLTNGNIHNITLTGNCTFTFSGATNSVGCSFTLILRQDATGSRTVTWPASVDWPSGVAPTLSPEASKVDLLSFLTIDGGTTWLGFVGGLDLR